MAETPERTIEPREFAEKLAYEANALKGEDIAILEVGEVIFITDFFVIITAQSNRQVRAIANSLDALAKKSTGHKGRLEGDNNAEWLLIDFGSVIAHVFTPTAREFYNLENLWAE